MRTVDTNAGLFSWCLENRHDKCKRQFRKYYFDGKHPMPIYTGEIVMCTCAKRGCKCKDQTPVKKTETLKEL